MSEAVVFQGITFRRYPEAKARSERVYFVPNGHDRNKGVGRLHQEVWKAANGPIPEGHDVHHVDFDPLNNDLGNLACIPHDVHMQEHRDHDPAWAARWDSVEWRAHLSRARVKANEWHRSPEGREWHRQHGERAMAARKLRAGVCESCGNAFTSKRPDRFCSNRCKSAARRASGVDDEQRVCARCGGVFMINRYVKTRTCSRTCKPVDRSEGSATLGV